MNIKRGKSIILEKTAEMEKIDELLEELVNERKRESRQKITLAVKEQVQALVLRLRSPGEWKD